MNSFNHAAKFLYTRLFEVVDDADYALIKVTHAYNVEFHQRGRCILIPEVKQLFRLSSTSYVILTPEEVTAFLDNLFLLAGNDADLMSISPGNYEFEVHKCDIEGILGPNLVSRFVISKKSWFKRWRLKKYFSWIDTIVKLN